ncbi:hypothetical protein JCM3766R1_005595 [Sporobolomyces carnicolor]
MTNRLTSEHGPSEIDDLLSRDFPEVASLPRDELEQLVDDRDFFDAFLHSRVAQAVQLDDAVTSQIKENLELARKSLELQPELERLRNETSDLFKEASELQQRAHLLAQAQQETYRRFSRDAQLNRYRAATTIQDHLCESLLQSFLEGSSSSSSTTTTTTLEEEERRRRQRGQGGGGGGEVSSSSANHNNAASSSSFEDQEFVKQYRDVRKVYHKRMIGLRKWEEGKVVWET